MGILILQILHLETFFLQSRKIVAIKKFNLKKK